MRLIGWMRRIKLAERVVITGAASGIGRALVERYLERGDEVLALDLDQEGLQSLSCATMMLDVQEATSFEGIREWGRPSIWINNAGIVRMAPFRKISLEEFKRVIDVNLMGVVYGTRAALEQMSEPSSGKIANVASLNGVVAAPFASSYCASKHAVVGLTRSLQEELAAEHSPIQLSLILPGFVRTKINQVPDFPIPKWVEWMVEEPEKTAREIVEGIDAGQREIVPTTHAKLMKRLGGWFPGWTAKSSRSLFAKNWKELLGLEPIEK